MNRSLNVLGIITLTLALPSTGIPYVIVNGTVVVDNSEVQKVFPGVAIRNAIIQ